MAIAAMILWMFTAGAGLYLLTAAAARRAAISPAKAPAGTTAQADATAQHPAGATAQHPADSGAVLTAPPRIAGPDGRILPPPTPHTRVQPDPGEHPLLEFSHPALGVVGLGFWIAYVASHFPVFAWIAFAVVIATIAAGLSWLVGNARAAARMRGGQTGLGAVARTALRPPAGERASDVPVARILVHGLSAATTFALAALTLLIAVR